MKALLTYVGRNDKTYLKNQNLTYVSRKELSKEQEMLYIITLSFQVGNVCMEALKIGTSCARKEMLSGKRFFDSNQSDMHANDNGCWILFTHKDMRNTDNL